MAYYLDTCPYHYGTKEYYAWWEMQHQQQIREATARYRNIQDQISYLRSIAFGHDFDANRTCRLCGMGDREYRSTPPAARSMCKSTLPCPTA